MYNPTDELLHVREVFTTESFLHLHLPDSDAENSFGFEASLSSPTSSEGMWQIPGKSEKEIIHLMFRATHPGSFSGYVHVKTDRENMVLPVELHVLKGGLHPTPKEFDFGIITSPDEHRVVPVSLLNSGGAPIALLEAMPAVHDPQLHVKYSKGVVIAAGEVATDVVQLVYTGTTPGQVSGKIVMTTNHSNAGLASVEVYYTAHVLHGGVGYERGHVSFVVPTTNSSLALSNQRGYSGIALP